MTAMKSVFGISGARYDIWEPTVPWIGPEPQRVDTFPPVFFRDNHVGSVKSWRKGPAGLWLQAQLDASDRHWQEIKLLVEAGKIAASPILLDKLKQFLGLTLDSTKSEPTIVTYSEASALFARSGLKSALLDTAKAPSCNHYKIVHARCVPEELAWIVQRAAGDCGAERRLAAIRIAFFLPEDQDDLDERRDYEKAGLPVPWKFYSDESPSLLGFIWQDDPSRIYINAGLDPDDEERVRRVVSHEVYHGAEFAQWGDVVKDWPRSKWEADAESYADTYLKAWRKGERWATKYAEA